jgi:alkylhydroperoxidase/carboxymuconolactone decarboxylase family protein YurZ
MANASVVRDVSKMQNLKALDPRTRHLALALACLIGERRSDCRLHIRYARDLGVTSDEIMHLAYLSIPAIGLWRAAAAARDVAEFLAAEEQVGQPTA